MQMQYAEVRLKSFTQRTRSWPHSLDTYFATPETLADAGFYWKPAGSSIDNVVCFLCRKSLDGWTDTDDPLDEHLSHSRHCGWAIVKSIPLVEDGLPFRWDDENELPKGERMTKARLETYGSWWPHERTKGWYGTSRRMANAGFFYAPADSSADNVQCPYCGLALEGWEASDDPVHEHQRRKPTCPFFATRAAAPTKASAAKAKKRTQKDTVTNAPPIKEQRVHGGILDHMDARTNIALDRLKSPLPQVESIETGSTTSSAILSATKSNSKREGAQSSLRSVEFNLPEKENVVVVEEQSSAKVPSGKGSATKKSDGKKESSQRRNRRTKSDGTEDITESIAPDDKELSVTTQDQPPSIARKRSQEASGESESALSSRSSSVLTKSKASGVSVVITKKRKLTKEERDHNRDNWGDSFNEATDSAAEDVPMDRTTNNILDLATTTRRSTSSVSSATEMSKKRASTKSLVSNDDGRDTQVTAEQHEPEPSKSSRTRRKETSTPVAPTDRRDSATPSDGDVNGHGSDNEVVDLVSGEPTPPPENEEVSDRDTPSSEDTTDHVGAENVTTQKRKGSLSSQAAETVESDNESHPVTPSRRSTSKTDGDGWEDDDAESEITSPFVSPSRWAQDGSLETSTPKSKEDSMEPSIPSLTPHQQIQDAIGIMGLSPIKSPLAKKGARSALMSPELKQQILIDRLGDLMQGDNASEVMATAEHALREEEKLLRRSQRKERILAAETSTGDGVHESDPKTQQDEDQMMVGSDDDGSGINDILQTPIKRTNTPFLLGQITPGTPTMKTPRPISQVISAIGAASRRNVHAPVSPFVRTPVKKKTADFLQPEDWELENVLGEEAMPDPTSSDLVPSSSVHLFDKKGEPQSMRSSGTTNTTFSVGANVTSNATLNLFRTSDIHRKKQVQEDATIANGRSLAIQEPSTSRVHIDPKESQRRLGLMKEADVTERELKMTVEEYHYRIMEEQVKLLELQADAWVQRFQEESDRVRRALLDDGSGTSSVL